MLIQDVGIAEGQKVGRYTTIFFPCKNGCTHCCSMISTLFP